MSFFLHKLADVKSDKIGSKTSIWQFVVILEGAVIGNNCNINANVLVENDVIIGDNVTVKSGVQLWDGIRIEDNVFIGPNATFTNDIIPRSKKYPEKFERTIIRKGASIGANATIVAGNEIGENSLVGAGAIVTKSIGTNEVWYGCPAKHIGFVTTEGDLLDLNLINKFGEKYSWCNNNLLKING